MSAYTDALASKRDKLRAEEAAVGRIVAEKRDELKEAEAALRGVQARIAEVERDMAAEAQG